MRRVPLSIAFVLRDPLPPLRADVLALFGAYLPRLGIGSTLVGQSAASRRAPTPACAPAANRESAAASFETVWPAARMLAMGRVGGALGALATPLWDAVGLLRARWRGPVACVQVRDKIASALVARAAAALLGVPFVYWMSFPIVEGYAARRDALAQRGRGVRWAAHALRARLARVVAYRLVLPRAAHVFVQSDAMAAWLAGQGVPPARMTAVPMGVDTAVFDRARVAPARDARLDGRRVVIYLGSVAQSRHSDFLLELAAALAAAVPAVLLVIAGDAPSPDEMAWMRAAIAARGLRDHVLLTGWLPQQAALGYAVRAEVGISPLPRGVLFDVASPTKLVEYLALGIASVANDIPDQQRVLADSGAGLCAPMTLAPFAAAVLRLLGDPALRAACAARGPPYVRAERSYAVLARRVADAYTGIVPDDGAAP
jgi:glycosyltransferase involved in cell wall biosynthesis